MKVLVLNAGSSSLKFMLFEMEDEKVLAKGLVERLGSDAPNLIYKRFDGVEFEGEIKVKDHVEAIKAVCDKLLDRKLGVIKDLKEVGAIGHRVVHGGEEATKTVVIDSAVKKIITDCIPLAPLHNPPNLAGIEACEKAFPGVPNVGVFDTAFHQTMSPEAYLYALPYELYTKYGIRKYGFHGTSHSYVSRAAANFVNLSLNNSKIIVCHLGNGCSMAAINNGNVIDTTMGMTPLEGLVMGTRCGDIDPAIVLRLLELGNAPQDVDKILNKESGLFGVGGINSSDMRDIITASESGDQQALRARRMFVRRVVKYIGSYYALLNGVDMIVFTGGIGEYSAFVREKIVASLTAFGVGLNQKVNAETLGVPAVISNKHSRFKVVVMPTNEELMIARETAKTISNND
ncbi:acetate kinase [Lentisphaerota bacterium WC36G]|nr:acetate kinase [Lentisphaerae bacterium WC36]